MHQMKRSWFFNIPASDSKMVKLYLFLLICTFYFLTYRSAFVKYISNIVSISFTFSGY